MEKRVTGITSKAYEVWLQKEGIPVHKAYYAVEDVRELPRESWPRFGGGSKGAYILLEGANQAWKGLYMLEIPPGGVIEAEKHIYHELFLVWQGRGMAEVWQEGQNNKVSFEFGKGSLFAMPLNAWHRLINGSQEPIVIIAGTSAPGVMQAFQGDTDFIFNCPYIFSNRFEGQSDFFNVQGRNRYRDETGFNVWETNFVPDVYTCHLDPQPEKAEEGIQNRFNMGGGIGGGFHVGGHIMEWPVGMYHKAHWHGPGAVLLGLQGEGYVLLWPYQYGIHPFQDGWEEIVAKVNWRAGSIYSPPYHGCFHQHFNTSREPARQLNFGGGSLGSPPSVERGPARRGPFFSIRTGGIMLEYEDEDPEIRRMFKEELAKKGVEFTMKPLDYRPDPPEIYWQTVPPKK